VAPALQDRSRVAGWLLLCALLAFSLPAMARSHRRAARAAARREHLLLSGQALQSRRLEKGKAALTRLKADRRRRKYRDGWEAVARQLDAAVRADPSGSRAAEAAFFGARVREELWNVSRTRRDAAAAIASYRSVDERYAGTEPAAHALASGVRLAAHVKDLREATLLGRRLSRYPRTAEAAWALALVRVPARPAQARRAPAEPGTRAAAKGDRAAQRPVEVDESDADETSDRAEDSPSIGGRTTSADPIAPADRDGPSRPVGLQPGPPPPSPSREPDTDVPAEASRILDDLVAATRGAANGAVATTQAALAEARTEPKVETDPARTAPAAAAADAESDEEGDADAAGLADGAQGQAAAAADPGKAALAARKIRSAALSDRSASVAAQLGLKVRKVVIDPGHGGRDAGAVGPHGLREKTVALAIARKLAARLRAQGLSVVLTRDRDVFVSLDDRTRIANEAHADLFVSIHCNAARRRNLSGVETWTLNVASDRYAARLAAYENAEDERRVSDLRLILADLATKANAGDARELAQSVQTSLVRTLRSRVGSVRDNGVKQALFYVLLGTRMPSILVETAFLSNPEEEARLRSAKYQDGTADAIARGMRDFLDGRRKLAMVP
jgi:N-acetylmuramoyl-L-alanine amidase